MSVRHDGDTHTFADGTKLRMINERILVQMHKEKDTVSSGLLFKPQNAHEHVYATGEILAFGSVHEHKQVGTAETKSVSPYPIPDLQVGDHVCFIKFRKLQDSNVKLQEVFGDGIIILKTEDVIFAYPPEDVPELGQ